MNFTPRTDHFCGYVTHFPANQSDRFERCDRPAALKRGKYWFCAEHFDMVEDAIEGGHAAISVGDITITGTPTITEGWVDEF